MELPGSNGGFGLLENAQVGAEQGRLRALAGRTGGEGETREGLEKAAREFEAVFLNQLMKAMRQTVPENKLFNSQGATKFYRQMHDQEMARALATGRSGLGVADLIVQQLERSVARSEEAAAAPALPGEP
ncbi:MAG: rod-binding protein, partial [Krumholzibacteria bacterium]|nr:rod-binding protein [Candidatus Krumholzibacteria bacterium]